MVEASNDHLARIESYLVQVNCLIVENETRISRQEAAINERVSTGRDTTGASGVLRIMRDTLALMRNHQKLLQREQERASQDRTLPPHQP